MDRADRIAVARAAVALCRVESAADTDATATADGFAFLERFAGQHQILGCVLRGWLGHPSTTGAPDDLRDRAAALLRGLRQRAVLFDLEADRVRERLRETGIPFLPLKGAALPEGLFAEPVDRHRQDLDLWVPRDDLTRCLDAFDGLGYAPPHDARRYRAEHFHLPLYHRDGYVAEIHWDLQRPDAVFRIDAARMRSGARDGRPHPADVAWHLIQQIAEESFGRLSRWIDLDRLFRRRNADFDARFSEVRGVESLTGVAALALDLGRVWFDSPAPPIPDAWRGGARARRYLNRFDPAATVLWRKLRFRPTAERSFLRWLLPAGVPRRRLREDASVSRGRMLAFHLSLWTLGFGPPDGDLPHERDHKRWRSSQPRSSDRL